MAMATSTEREVMRARADISGATITGTAEFVEVARGTQRLVRISMRVQGDPTVLTPGLHADHIHERGSCEHGDPPFMSAMGHFDPGPAGNTDPDVNQPFHMGDLPNIRIGPDGSGVLEALSTRITLSDGPLCILSGDGSEAKDRHSPGHSQLLGFGRIRGRVFVAFSIDASRGPLSQ